MWVFLDIQKNISSLASSLAGRMILFQSADTHHLNAFHSHLFASSYICMIKKYIFIIFCYIYSINLLYLLYIVNIFVYLNDQKTSEAQRSKTKGSICNALIAIRPTNKLVESRGLIFMLRPTIHG